MLITLNVPLVLLMFDRGATGCFVKVYFPYTPKFCGNHEKKIIYTSLVFFEVCFDLCQMFELSMPVSFLAHFTSRGRRGHLRVAISVDF